MPALADLPQPLVLALQTHLSIGWYLGTLLNPKRGFNMNVSQRTNAGEIVWDLARAQPPNDDRGWLLTEESLNLGQDLALVVSVTHDAQVDAKRAIDNLALPIGRLAHACLQEPGPDAVQDVATPAGWRMPWRGRCESWWWCIHPAGCMSLPPALWD